MHEISSFVSVSLWSDIVLEFFCSPPRVRRLYCHSGRPGIVPVSASSPCRIFLVSPALLVSATSFSSSMLGRSTRLARPFPQGLLAAFLISLQKALFQCQRPHVEFFSYLLLSTSFAGPSFSSGLPATFWISLPCVMWAATVLIVAPSAATCVEGSFLICTYTYTSV